MRASSPPASSKTKDPSQENPGPSKPSGSRGTNHQSNHGPSDKQRRHSNFQGPEGGCRKFDLDELKRLTVRIERAVPKTDQPVMKTTITNPDEIAPIRRPDEGKKPLFSDILTGDVRASSEERRARNKKRESKSPSHKRKGRSEDRRRSVSPRSRSRSRSGSRRRRRRSSSSSSERRSRSRSRARRHRMRSYERERRSRRSRSRSRSRRSSQDRRREDMALVRYDGNAGPSRYPGPRPRMMRPPMFRPPFVYYPPPIALPCPPMFPPPFRPMFRPPRFPPRN